MNLKNLTHIDLDNINLDIRGKINRAGKKFFSWLFFMLLLGARPILQMYLQATQNLYGALEEAIAVRKKARQKQPDAQEETEVEDKPLAPPNTIGELVKLQLQSEDLGERKRLEESMERLRKA